MDCATSGDGQSCASDAVAIFALFGIRLTIAACPSGYTPAQITSAYGLNGITFTSSSGTKVAGDGSGQTIALIEMYSDPNIQASLNAFDAEYDLPNITLDVINQAGSQTNTGWAEEESLDVEWAHAMAPGANIVVIEAAPGNTDSQVLTNLMTAVQTANRHGGCHGCIDELGIQRVQQRVLVRFQLHDTGHHLHRLQRRQRRCRVAGRLAECPRRRRNDA